MKTQPFRFFLLLLIPFLVASLEAQEVYVPKTKLEALDLQIGAVVFKGSTLIGSFATRNAVVSVTCKESIDATNNQKEYGIAIGIGKEGERVEDITLVDYDELSPLLDAIERLSKVDYTVTSFANFEAAYATKGEFRLVTYKNSNGTGVRAALQSGSINHTKTYLALEQWSQLQALVVEAKAKLEEVIKANRENTTRPPQ